MTNQQVTIYGTAWCSDCKRAVRVLDQHNLDYNYINIEQDEAARQYVEEVNNGNQSVPTIVFFDGSIMVEPSSAKLTEKLVSLQLITIS
ncbi:MAG: mycoredoxin [Chloroflexi bacterium AL-W]|nr:mycoredoxin [Chloroflexi bacterium AL-N1]NOK66167.1 mycoredoxin [Chloroflexi bacterium AL-N10]NOK73048.1 mycoredoxin [Chloroflexi bacterium AL-N5]NOK79945.1 mycoredoxin [Chloroflexi bacterium AL-W]NOK88199.1 mycoredoxin [Chloroflexi bacterium AL-N15]